MLQVFQDALLRKNDRRLIPHRQPIRSLWASLDDPIERYEVLTRMWDRNRLIPAIEFIPWIRDEPEIQVALDFWVFETMAGIMRGDRLSPHYNLNICQASFDSWLHQKMSLIFAGIAPDRMTIELNESIDFRDSRLKIVRHLADVFRLELDDIGVSPLKNLISLPIVGIKIDGSITQQVVSSLRAAELVRSLLQFCKNCSLSATCEYVCTPEIWEKLRAIGQEFEDVKIFVQGEAVGDVEAIEYN